MLRIRCAPGVKIARPAAVGNSCLVASGVSLRRLREIQK